MSFVSPFGEQGKGQEEKGLEEHGSRAYEGEGVSRLDVQATLDEKAGKEKADVREEHRTRGTVREDLLGEAEKDRGDQTVKGCEKRKHHR